MFESVTLILTFILDNKKQKTIIKIKLIKTNNSDIIYRYIKKNKLQQIINWTSKATKGL